MPRPPRRRSARFVSLLAATLAFALLTGCEYREREPRRPDTPAREDLPPNDVDALAAMYEEDLEPFGLRLARGALIDTTNDGYDVSDTGTHLALYVEPVGAYPPERYLDNLVPVAAVFATDVFDRWPALESFDVCQEPPASVDADDEPEPDTQVNVTRSQSDALDWESLDAAGLIVVAIDEPPGADLVISDRIRALPRYEELLDEVEAETGVRPT